MSSITVSASTAKALSMLHEYMTYAHLRGYRNINLLCLGKDCFGVDINNVAQWWGRYQQNYASVHLVMAQKINSPQPPNGPKWFGIPNHDRRHARFDMDRLIQNAGQIRNDAEYQRLLNDWAELRRVRFPILRALLWKELRLARAT